MSFRDSVRRLNGGTGRSPAASNADDYDFDAERAARWDYLFGAPEVDIEARANQQQRRDVDAAQTDALSDEAAKLRRAQAWANHRMEVAGKVAQAKREAEDAGRAFIAPPMLPAEVPAWFQSGRQEGVSESRVVNVSLAEVFGIAPSSAPLPRDGQVTVQNIGSPLAYGTPPTAPPVTTTAEAFGYATPAPRQLTAEEKIAAASKDNNA